jgi:thiaminase/transcriptional activator TenA
VDGSTPSLFDDLRSATLMDWERYTCHAFVARLADGSLPLACFRYYLQQDYRFLIHFARAYGLASFKADTLADIRAAALGLTAIIDREIDLHVRKCRELGMSEEALTAVAESNATLAYTCFVIERGLAGDLLDLHVALAPCVVGYAEIGRRLISDERTVLAGNPYEEWMETYAADDYQAIAAAQVAHMDRLMERRGSPARIAELRQTFASATRLEVDFWQAALDQAA